MIKWWNADIDEKLLYDLYHINSENFIECTSVQIYSPDKKKKTVYDKGCIKLPESKLNKNSEFERILHSRRSAKYFENNLNICNDDKLSKFCGLAFGESIYKPEFRTYPSGGALYPVNIHLAFNKDICDLHKYGDYSVFKYYPRNELEPVSKDNWSELSKMIIANDLSNCQLAIILSTNFDESNEKYKKIAYRLIQQEAGHIGQNIMLTAEYLGFDTIPLGGYYESFTKQVIKDKNSKILYVILLG